MKKIYLASVTTILILILSGCGGKNEKAQGVSPTSEVSNISVFKSGAPPEIVEILQALIKGVSDNITAVEITFTTSRNESSSLDTIIVTIATANENELAEQEIASIKSIINSSEIDKIIDYSKVEIMYSE